jgi:hypothetical protein
VEETTKDHHSRLAGGGESFGHHGALRLKIMVG